MVEILDDKTGGVRPWNTARAIYPKASMVFHNSIIWGASNDITDGEEPGVGVQWSNMQSGNGTLTTDDVATVEDYDRLETITGNNITTVLGSIDEKIVTIGDFLCSEHNVAGILAISVDGDNPTVLPFDDTTSENGLLTIVDDVLTTTKAIVVGGIVVAIKLETVPGNDFFALQLETTDDNGVTWFGLPNSAYRIFQDNGASAKFNLRNTIPYPAGTKLRFVVYRISGAGANPQILTQRSLIRTLSIGGSVAELAPGIRILITVFEFE